MEISLLLSLLPALVCFVVAQQATKEPQSLRCEYTSYAVKFSQSVRTCTSVNVPCNVTGLPAGQASEVRVVQVSEVPGITITNNGTKTTVILQICVEAGTKKGNDAIMLQFTVPSSSTIEPLNFVLLVTVTDNNIPPAFNQDTTEPYTFRVPENTELGTVIVHVNKSITQTCYYRDGCIQVIDYNLNQALGIDSLSLTVNPGSYKGIEYITKSDRLSLGYFAVTGSLKELAGTRPSFAMTVTDGGRLSNSATAIFNIEDVNDPPVCISTSLEASIVISAPVGTTVSQVICTDPDITPDYRGISYTLERNEYSDYFSVSSEGRVMLKNSLSSLGAGQYLVMVKAADLKGDQIATYIKLTIMVKDTSSKCSLMTGCLPQSWNVGSNCSLWLKCQSDGVNIIGVNTTGIPSIFTVWPSQKSATAWELYLVLNEYIPGLFNLSVVASFDGLPASIYYIAIPVFQRPVFPQSQYSVTVMDTLPVGASITNVGVSRGKNEEPVAYRITVPFSAKVFKILDNGTLLLQSALDFDIMSYSFSIEARGTISDLTASTNMYVSVKPGYVPVECLLPNTSPTVEATMSLGTVIFSIKCTTRAPLRVSYTIQTDPPSIKFNINEVGDISLAEQLPNTVENVTVTVNVSNNRDIKSFIILIYFERCPTTTENGITFLSVITGSSFSAPCPQGYQGTVQRDCNSDKTWGPFNMNKCSREDLLGSLVKVKYLEQSIGNATQVEVENVLKDIASEVRGSLGQSSEIMSGDIRMVVDILSNIGSVTKQRKDVAVDEKTLQDHVDIADRLLSASTKQWEALEEDFVHVGANLLIATDEIFSSSLRSPSLPDSPKPIVKEKIVIQRGKTKDDIRFSIETEASMNKSWVTSSGNTVFFPKEAFGTGTAKVPYSVVLFRGVTDVIKVDSELQNNYTQGKDIQNKLLNSDVLSFTIIGNISKLSPPVELTFSKLQGNYSAPTCGFLDTSVSDIGLWSSTGCTVKNESEFEVVCTCDHLTNFAILMSPHGAPSAELHKVLSIISAVGCAISILCLVITILLYFVVWKYVKNDRSVLHVNLCVCLILAYGLFLAGIDQTGEKTACIVIAALLHFLFLSVFFIMLCEGIEILKSTTLVFPSDSLMCKFYFIMYGVPLIIVAISLGVTKTEGYGTEDFCWLSLENNILWAFIGPALFVVLVNFIILIKVLCTMQRSRHMLNKGAQKRTVSVVRTIAVLSPILGVTWAFGILSVNSDLVVFQFVFAILNSLQGLFIFIFHCVMPSQVRDGLRSMRRLHRARSYDSSSKMNDSRQARRISHSTTLPSYSMADSQSTSGPYYSPVGHRSPPQTMNPTAAQSGRGRRLSDSSSPSSMGDSQRTNGLNSSVGPRSPGHAIPSTLQYGNTNATTQAARIQGLRDM